MRLVDVYVRKLLSSYGDEERDTIIKIVKLLGDEKLYNLIQEYEVLLQRLRKSEDKEYSKFDYDLSKDEEETVRRLSSIERHILILLNRKLKINPDVVG